ncbi:MAG: hydrogenase nickel incorporation protein HypB [Bacteroidales bacterium]|nr:hydrogenase nickel incorporation protein HypB [Bacteroidales bacterium]
MADEHLSAHAHDHSHDHPHSHSHDSSEHTHHHDHDHSRTLNIEQDALQQNNLVAERNRGFLEAKEILAVNLVSSPGSGKTTLLEKTLVDLSSSLGFFVIEGDQQTANDAARIQKTGVPVIQVNTGSGCHLDAEMVYRSVKELKITDHAVLMIENVGNLVCPALFDLGEKFRVVIISVTEGDDKALKYPYMFQSSHLCIINKTDLLPYVDFDVEKFKEYALRINHHLEFIELSAKSGDGLNDWYSWIKKQTK